MGTVLFIENEYQTEHHFTRGFRLGAVRSGWNPAVVWLRDGENQLRSPQLIAKEIEAQKPDLILWIMDYVLPVAECLDTPLLRTIPKASLWFDDYQRTFAIHRFPEKHQHLTTHGLLKTHVWDGYWRDQFQKRFQVPCRPIHLAADEIDYFPKEATHFKGHENSLIFIGNIPSIDFILQEAKKLPPLCEALILHVSEIISKSAYGTLPYNALEEAYQALSEKKKIVVDHFRGDIAQNILVNRLVWMLGKRETRIRILRLAAKQREVVILSGHSDKGFAKAHELTRDLQQGSPHHLKFIDTDHVLLHQLGCLYHIGGLHLQATDPQSVRGGIPFRVFETAASARPLLSDFKPELADCFKPGEEILCFKNDEDFPDQLNLALKNPKRLQEIAEAAHQRFLKEHTWKHRFQTILEP